MLIAILLFGRQNSIIAMWMVAIIAAIRVIPGNGFAVIFR